MKTCFISFEHATFVPMLLLPARIILPIDYMINLTNVLDWNEQK